VVCLFPLISQVQSNSSTNKQTNKQTIDVLVKHQRICIDTKYRIGNIRTGFPQKISIHKYRIVNNKKWVSTMDLETSELDFLQGFPFTSTELVTSELDFLQGFPFTSTELVTSELDFLKRISIHKYRIGNIRTTFPQGFPFTSTELVTIRNGFPQMDLETPELDFLKGFPFTSTELVTSEMGFHNGFGNTRTGFPQRISIHKYRIGNNQKWVSTMDFHFASTELVTSEMDFYKGFPFPSIELETSELDFHKGFPFASIEFPYYLISSFK
jgi:hypothetical protein